MLYDANRRMIAEMEKRQQDWLTGITNKILANLERDQKRRQKKADALRPYLHHKNSCAAFPARSEEQIKRDCNCGLSKAFEGIL